MNYKKLFGYGALIWGIVYVIAMGLYAYGAIETLWGKILLVVLSGVLAYLFALKIKASSIKIILGYSVGWVIVAFILDVLLTVPYTGWQIFAQWSMLVGYALILLAPLLTVKKQ